MSVDNAPYLTPKAKEILGEQAVGEFLREVIWRLHVGYEPLDNYTGRQVAELLGSASSASFQRADRVAMALALLRTARANEDDEGFTRWSDYASSLAQAGSDEAAALVHEECLRAQDRYDLSALNDLVGRLDGPDPAWRLRAAGFQCQLGEIDAAREKVRSAVADLRARQRTTPESVWITSRLAWAEWFASALKRDVDLSPMEWTSTYKDWKSDPFDLLQNIQSATAQDAKKQREEARKVLPGFEPGHYKDPSKTITLGGPSGATPLYQLTRLLEDSGIPIRLRHLGLAATELKEAAELEFEDSAAWYLTFLRAAGRSSDKTVNDYLSRIAVARMSEATARDLAARLTVAIRYWWLRLASKASVDTILDQVPLCIEALARIAVRASKSEAVQHFTLALELAKDPFAAHHLVSRPLGQLAKNSILALAPKERCLFSFDAIAFPLSGEAGAKVPQEWPDSSDWLALMDLSSVVPDAKWAARIDQLILACRDSDIDRGHATVRLLYLMAAGLLSSTQLADFGEALWSRVDDESCPLPSGTNLYTHVFAHLPAPERVEAESRVRIRLFDMLLPTGVDLFAALAAAALPGKGRSPLLPTHERAKKMFDGLATWRPKSAEKLDPHVAFTAALSGQTDESTALSLSRAMAFCVVPAMSAEDRTNERLQALFALLDEVQIGLALAALPHFIVPGRDNPAIIERLRQGLLSKEFENVAGSCDAIAIWLKREINLGPLPLLLAEQSVGLFEARHSTGLHLLTRCIRKLILAKKLTANQIDRVLLGLEELSNETEYSSLTIGDWDAVSASLLRAECVRLSNAIAQNYGPSDIATWWIEMAPHDPLPEVRYAVI